MSDNNKTNPKQEEEALKSRVSNAQSAATTSAWKKLLSKKWVSPAAFLAAAAIIVTLMWLYQGPEQEPTITDTPGLTEAIEGEEGVVQQPDNETLEVIAGDEQVQWPVLNHSELKVILPFYDANASLEEREAALMQAGNTFHPHMGIDLASQSNESFDVLAVLSGEVTVAEKHPTNGNVVEITHADGSVAVYQSLADVNVKAGDVVKQGTIIAKAGRNELEKDLGVHLHFEIKKNGESLNPLELFEEN